MTNPQTDHPTTAKPALDNRERFDRSQIPDDVEGLALYVFTVLTNGPDVALKNDKIPIAFSAGIVNGLVEALDGLIAATADSEDEGQREAHNACMVIRKMFETDEAQASRKAVADA